MSASKSESGEDDLRGAVVEAHDFGPWHEFLQTLGDFDLQLALSCPVGAELGLLADGLSHLGPKLKSLYGDKVRLVPYGPKRPFFRRFGASLLTDALDQIEERAMLSRYGI